MKKKENTHEHKNPKVNEREPVYETSPGVDKWDPNKPFQGTQEEWWEHFHEIEKGKFTPLDVANKEFEEWKEKHLKNRL